MQSPIWPFCTDPKYTTSVHLYVNLLLLKQKKVVWKGRLKHTPRLLLCHTWEGLCFSSQTCRGVSSCFNFFPLQAPNSHYMEAAASVLPLIVWVCSVHPEFEWRDGFLAFRVFLLLAYNIHKMLETFWITLHNPETISPSEGKTAQRCNWKAASDSRTQLKVGVTRVVLCLFHDTCPSLLIFMNGFA